MNEHTIWMISTLLVNLFIATAAISILRYIQGLLAGVNTTSELSKRDNFAFGISFAGGAVGLALVLSAAVSGEASVRLSDEIITVALYAMVGIILLKLGVVINDKVIFNRLSLKEHVINQNVAAGTIQAANMLGLGVIINAAVNWVEADTVMGVAYVAIVFVVTQLILLTIARLRGRIYKGRHNGKELQDAIADGHTALAVRYAGHLLGAALAVSAASGLVVFSITDTWWSIGYWFVTALGLALALSLLSLIARRVILAGINVVEEVDQQHNTGVAFVEAAIFIAFGLILRALLM